MMESLKGTGRWRMATCLGALLLAAVLGLAGSDAQGQVRSAYSSLISDAHGKCVDIEGASWGNGALALQYPCSGADNQQYTLVAQPGGFQVVTKHSGKCLAPAAGSVLAQTSVVQDNCAVVAAQLWTPQRQGGAWQLRLGASGLCLSTAAGPADLQPVRLAACATAAVQRFQFDAGWLAAGVGATVVARHSGHCLSGALPPVQNAALTQVACAGAARQVWLLQHVGNAYRLALGTTGLCAGIGGASTAPGAPVRLLACGNAPSLLWALQPGSGHYRIVASHSGLCLDVAAASLSEGAGAIQYTCQAGSANQQWSLGAPASAAAWSGVIDMPLVPAAAANLADGRVLTWSAFSAFAWSGVNSPAQTVTGIFDPASGTTTSAVVSNTAHDMFCPGTSMLADGSILVNGGNSNARTSIYRQDSGLWTSGPDMLIARGYPGNATLSNGDVLTLGGFWSGATQGRSGEVWNANTGWTPRSSIPSGPLAGNDPGGVFRGDNHYWLFAMADGMVFHAGPAPAMHHITTDGNGSVSSAGLRADDAYSMNGNAILYDQGKILKLGGAPAYEDAWATAAAYVVEFDATSQYARRTAPMQFARAFANSVLLPSGQVVVAGGQAYAMPFSDDRSVLAPELWDPRTEVFARLPPMQVPRNYHAVALLLPDARVLVGGGGLCGDCGTNHANVEILTPPYLLNADGSAAPRPAILSATSQAGYGGTVAVTTDSPVANFVMMRMSSVTHSLNNDQRLLKLVAWSGDARNYSLLMPGAPGHAIPGYYMLFAMSPSGVPSVARSIALR